MTSFIRTDKGLVNLASVARVTYRNNGCYCLNDAEENHLGDVLPGDFDDHIVQLIPASGAPVERLDLSFEDSTSPPEIEPEPIVAWGLTVMGRVRPIMLGQYSEDIVDRQPSGEDLFLCVVGKPEVIQPGSIRTLKP